MNPQKHGAEKMMRVARPDAEVGSKIHLIKGTTHLRLTYQIRLLAYMARTKGKTLVVHLPEDATVHASLDQFVRELDGLVSIERG